MFVSSKEFCRYNNLKIKHMKKNKIIILMVLFFLESTLLNAQVDPQITWQNTIGTTFIDYYSLIQQTADGGYILGGYTMSGISGDKTQISKGIYDYWILKLDNTGNIVWQTDIGGGNSDKLAAIEQTSDGGYILGGTSNSNNLGGDKTENPFASSNDYWVVKLNASGVIQWDKTIGGDLDDIMTGIHQTSDGGYLIGGTSYSDVSGNKTDASDFNGDYWVVKLNASGNILWQNSIGGDYSDVLKSFSLTSDGGCILGGVSNSNISKDKTEDSIAYDDLWVVKLDNLGTIQWQNTIGSADNDRFNSIVQTVDGGYIVGATSNAAISGDKTENSIGSYDYWVLKLDNVGGIQWQNTIGGDMPDYLSNVAQTPDGGYIVGGGSPSGISGDKTENSVSNDMWILKLNATGNIVWQNTIEGNNFDDFKYVLPTNDGQYVVVSESNSNISGDKTENSIGTSNYWVLKLREPNHIIHGNVFTDYNHSCIYDPFTELLIPNKIIHDIQSGANAISQSNGNYDLLIYNDSACIYISNLTIGEVPSCILNDTFWFNFDSTSSLDTFNNDFGLIGDTCDRLHVDIASGNMNLCSYTTFTINYYNDGYQEAYDAFMYILVDTSILDSFGSSLPFVLIGDSLFFDLGGVMPFEYGSFTFFAHIKCSTIIGTSACTKAYIYPISDCPPPVVGYDGSDIEVETTCDADTVHVVLKNHGSNMANPGIITAIDDEIIQRIEPYILNSNASIQFDYFVGINKTLTLKINQNNFHPQRPIIILHDELCALTTPIKMNSVINHFSRYDDANEYEEVCQLILASHDPNIKSVVPEGYTSQHYTDSNQVLEYRIDFQNTGLDTARKVVVIDTISNWLNISTFVPLVSSHTYITQLEGTNIVKFIFDPISLPDSNASEPNSHGYVTFKIRPKFNTPKGTIVNNFADIYFDYNAPVRTNTVFNTIYDTVLVRIGLGLNEAKENLEPHVLVFPNPTIDKFYIQLDKGVKEMQIKLVDATGKAVYEVSNLTGNNIEMKASDLNHGIYFIQIYDKNKLIGRSKIVIQ